jgi:hypothetical protein
LPTVDITSQRQVVRLEVVTSRDAGGRVTPIFVRGAPAFRGHSQTDYVCGACGMVICEGVRLGSFAGIVFHCGSCGELNRVPAPC